MSVYVDNSIVRWRGKKWCHLTADSLDELHEFAAKIGMKRAWFQEHARPERCHYDLTESRRAAAVKLGAIEEDRKTLVRRLGKAAEDRQSVI